MIRAVLGLSGSVPWDVAWQLHPIMRDAFSVALGEIRTGYTYNFEGRVWVDKKGQIIDT